MKVEELQNKKILIVGYGKEGQSAERFLRHHLPNAVIEVADQKDGEDYLEKQKDFDIAVKSPGIQKEKITIPYTTPTNLFFGNSKNQVIGVTGTKGKSTTTTLIYEMIKATNRPVHLVGNIGNPMLDELLKHHSEDDVFVAELSSYQLSDISYSPHISVVLNLFPEHMNYHGDVESYYEAKHNIIKNVTENDYFVYGSEYPLLQYWAKETKAKTVEIIKDLPFEIVATQLKGEHNLYNVKAAVTVGQILKIPTELMKKVVEEFKPLPHRLEKVGTFKDITFYDDAISTTPESTIAALNSIANVSTLLLGGQNRGYEFKKLAEEIKNHNVKNIVLFPDSGHEIRKELEKVGEFHFLETESMREAVQFAFDHSLPNSVCLLSTASPSYSLWKNFEEKGAEFQRLVREYGQTVTSS